MFGKPVVGDDIGSDLGGAQMVHTDSGDVGHPQGCCRRDPSMTRDNAVGGVDQDRIDKAKFRDAGGDLFDLPGV